MGSTGHAWSYKAWCSAVVGWFGNNTGLQPTTAEHQKRKNLALINRKVNSCFRENNSQTTKKTATTCSHLKPARQLSSAVKSRSWQLIPLRLQLQYYEKKNELCETSWLDFFKSRQCATTTVRGRQQSLRVIFFERESLIYQQPCFAKQQFFTPFFFVGLA